MVHQNPADHLRAERKEMGSVLTLDSPGAFASCQRNHLKFALVNISERVRVLLQVAHVNNVLPLFNGVDAAEAESAQA